MWCLVSLPNSVVLEVELEAKALGQDCLNKVCQQLGIVETDFFGLLQVQTGPKDECGANVSYWLNLRNLLMRQLTGSPPYRLQMKIKFFVKPHNILQSATRNIFVKSLMPTIKDRSLECSEEEMVAFVSFIAQSELGDFKKAMLPALREQYKQYLPESMAEEEILAKLAQEHKKHRGVGSDSAIYKALQCASEWPGYGVEWHHAKPLHSGVPMTIGVGPRSIIIINEQTTEIESIEYEAVQKATHTGKSFYLHTMCDDATINTQTFKLANVRASNALYRCVTEMYLFYYCDTVRNDVASQFDRDIKGTLASLFSENKELGKKYVFDIQRTLQEAYDYNRRRLYTREYLASTTVTTGEREDDLTVVTVPVDVNDDMEASSSDGETNLLSDDDSNDCSCSYKACKSGVLAEWLLCKVCCDADINTVFCPCGHVTCCHDCALKLSNCPMCRQEITNLQPIFLPSLALNATGMDGIKLGSAL